MKRKDALTDLIEYTQGTKPTEPMTSPSGDRQVVNGQGETVTLGHKPSTPAAIPNKGIPLKLSEGEIEELTSAVRSAMNEAIDRFVAKLKQRKGT